MQVKEQNINVGKIIYEGDIKTSAEGSIIVPDVKPDMLKVLQVDADTFLCEKQIDNGKITLKGKVNVNVLYVPESEDCRVQCIKGCFEFCETLKNSEFAAGMRLAAVCEVEKVGYKLINSRKIGIDAQIVIGIQVIADKDCSFVCDIEDDAAEVKKCSIKLQSYDMCKDFSFKIDETLDFTAGKCCACDILKSNVMITEKEYRALTDKLVIKGRACVSLLYIDENGRLDHSDLEIPFTEVFDFEGLIEDTECEINYQICDTDFVITQDMNGDGKCISMDAEVNICVKCECHKEIPVICDCYLTNAECVSECTDIETDEIIDKPMFSAVLKELLQKEDGAPEIASVYTAVAKPYISSSQLQNGRIAVSGKTVVYVLYTTDNPQIPICSINEEIPFSYMIDCEHAARDSEILLNIECEHISYTISSSNAVEVRCGLGISGKLVKKSVTRIVKSVEERELPKEESGMVIYFVKDGDSIWDIAKRYHVKCDNILLCNGLEEDAELIKGEKLIIPVTTC